MFSVVRLIIYKRALEKYKLTFPRANIYCKVAEFQFFFWLSNKAKQGRNRVLVHEWCKQELFIDKLKFFPYRIKGL